MTGNAPSIVKIGLIGCGGITNPHVNGYLAIPEEVRVIAVADIDKEQAQKRSEQVGGAQVFTDYHEMIASADIDAVDICLPHHLHADAIVAAARAGKHVLCEKPLCITTAEADRVAAAVQEVGVTLMCAHNQLFMPPVAKARELIQGGELGQVYELRTSDCFFNRGLNADMGWRGHLEMAGGGELIDTGYHPTYLLLHLATAEPTEVVAMTSRHRLNMDGEDSARVLVRFADDSVGTIVTSWAYLPTDVNEKFTVVAERGTLWGYGRTLHHKTIDGHRTSFEFPEVQPFHAEIADFVRCVREGARPVNTETEGTHVLKVILGAYASVKEKRIVNLADL